MEPTRSSTSFGRKESKTEVQAVFSRICMEYIEPIIGYDCYDHSVLEYF